MADPTTDADVPSVGELALGSLLDEASTMRPDQVAVAVAQKAALIGLDEVAIHMVDKRQLVLRTLPAFDPESLDIDGTDAGRCFRESRLVEVDEGDGITRLWFPVLNGTSRLGVMGARTRDPGDLVRSRGMQLAGLTAELLEAKSAYGDHLVNASRTKELTLAAEIRWSTIPPLTFLSPDISIAGFLEPAYDIAGDTFDYAINGNTAHFAIIDAVGHGMEASRIANLALLAYRHCRRGGGGMVECYTAMDEAIEAAFDRSAYATAQLAALDLPSGVLRWLSAGHPAPLLVRSGEPVRELVGQSFLPAGIADGDPVIHEEELRPGDVVAFYSDGISEARSSTDDVFGVERLGQLLREAIDAGHQPPEIVRQVLHAALDHQGGETVDDATLVMVAWRF